MKKGTLILALTFVLTSFMLTDTEVYICNGAYSKKYHYEKDCEGLTNCSTAVEKVSLEKAEKLKRTLCGYESW